MSPLTLAALLMIASGSIHAVVNAIIKGGSDRFSRSIWLNLSSSVIVAPALFFVPLPHGAWLWLLPAVLVHALYFWLLALTLTRADFSSAYPVYRGSAPLITAAIAIPLFGEPATAIDIAGIAVIGAGMFMMLMGRHLDRATMGLSLATGTLVALYTVMDAQGVRAAPTPLSFIVWLFALMGIGSALIIPRLAETDLGAVARAEGRLLFVAGGLSLLTFGAALYALSLGPIAQLAALRETGMITALLISTFVFHERITAGRILAVLMICAGAVLILSG